MATRYESERDVAAQVYAAAAAEAGSRGYRLGEGADRFFQDHADRLAQNAVPSDSDGLAAAIDIDLAMANFRRVVDAMIDARADAYRDDPQRLQSAIIGEATLGAALSRLCPIWPFC